MWLAQGRLQLPTSRLIPRLYAVELLGKFQRFKLNSEKMKSIFWSGGWTRTIDLQGPSPGALLLSYAT